MDDDLPLEYDVIVVGTGMTESIVAAAASRIGKKVLHLDSDDYYGGMWASFNFENLIKLIKCNPNINEASSKIGIFNVHAQWCIKEKVMSDENEVNKILNEDNEIEKSENIESIEKNVNAENNQIIDEKSESNDCESTIVNGDDDTVKNGSFDEANVKKSHIIEWSQDSLKKEYRKFNIDLAPKLLFARGDLVELLISSNIARYNEFRCVNRVLTWLENGLEPVPCSRADVFATKHVSVVEKRMLMKLLSSMMDYDESNSEKFQDIESKTFLEYIKSKKLTNNLIHYVLYAIAGGSNTTPCKEGILKCKKFLTSLGRYGNTPFLWSMYGCGELPQGFCRLCAVYGGIYYLNRSIEKIYINHDCNESKSVKVHTNGKELKCEYIVMGVNKAPENLLSNIKFSKGISRAVFITNHSILEFEKESLTLLQFPPLEGKTNPVTIIELGPSTCSCPKGLYIVHMTCAQNSNAKDDLIDYAEKLFSFEECDLVISDTQDHTHKKPQVLWCFYFNMTDSTKEKLNTLENTKAFLCSGPDIELDFDHAVQEAREIFAKMYNDAEFLPRAPDPDEIIFDGDDSAIGPIFEKDIKKNPDQEDDTFSSAGEIYSNFAQSDENVENMAKNINESPEIAN